VSEFKVGDIVEAFGLRGIVEQIIPMANYCVAVDFGCGNRATFTMSGLAEDWHKVPALKLISRPQKTEKKKVWVCAMDHKPEREDVGIYKHIWVQIEGEVSVEE
jgi:hypothetical protein